MTRSADSDAEHGTAAGRALDVWLSEYSTLRREIEHLIATENLYLNLAVTLTAALIAASRFVFGDSFHLLSTTILGVAPLPFLVLCFLFTRAHEEIHVVASYLAGELRSRINFLCVPYGDTLLWEISKYQAESYLTTRRPHTRFRRIANELRRSRTVYFIKLLIFLAPATFLWLLFAVDLFIEGPRLQDPGTFFAGVILFGIDALILLYFFIFIRKELGVPEELVRTTGGPRISNIEQD